MIENHRLYVELHTCGEPLIRVEYKLSGRLIKTSFQSSKGRDTAKCPSCEKVLKENDLLRWGSRRHIEGGLAPLLVHSNKKGEKELNDQKGFVIQ